MDERWDVFLCGSTSRRSILMTRRDRDALITSLATAQTEVKLTLLRSTDTLNDACLRMLKTKYRYFRTVPASSYVSRFERYHIRGEVSESPLFDPQRRRSGCRVQTQKLGPLSSTNLVNSARTRTGTELHSSRYHGACLAKCDTFVDDQMRFL
jgi:hypothetical protein